MKVTKWVTELEFVDQQTGEVIKEREVKDKYVKVKKIKSIKYENRYDTRTFNIEKVGIITYTVECTTDGKQLGFW